MTKALTPTEIQNAMSQLKRVIKNSDYTTLRTDLGRSVEVTTATQLVLLNRFTGSQPFLELEKLCNQNDTHLKMCIISLIMKTEDQQSTKLERPQNHYKNILGNKRVYQKTSARERYAPPI